MADDREEEVRLVTVVKGQNRFHTIDVIEEDGNSQNRYFIPNSNLEEQSDVSEIRIQMDNLKGHRQSENYQSSDLMLNSSPNLKRKQRAAQKEGAPEKQVNQEVTLLQVDPSKETKTFNLMRLKTQSSNEGIRNQMKKFLKGAFENVCARKLPLPAAAFIIDGASNLCEEHSDILRNALEMTPCKGAMYLVNGLIKTNMINQGMETICVCSDRQFKFIEGFTEFGSVCQAVIKGGVNVYDCIKYIVLLKNASDDDIRRYLLAMQQLFFSEYKVPCLKILMGDNRDDIRFVSTGEYFEKTVPTLFINIGNGLSDALGSFINSPTIDSKFYMYEMQNKSGFVQLHETITIALCQGIDPCINVIMDSSRELANNLANKGSYKTYSKILLFDNILYYSDGDLPNFWQYKEYPTIKKLMLENKDNVEIISCKEEADSKAMETIKILQDHLQEDVLSKYFDLISENCRGNVLRHCPLLGIRYALKENDVKLADDLIKFNALDLYPYIYFRIKDHWNDAPIKTDNKISKHFKIKNGTLDGSTINKAISKLTDDFFGDFFNEEGRPNIEVVNPIQVLMVNRLICMQLEFVKLLWSYDKKNSLANALLLWILIDGILKEGIFGSENSVDDLMSLKAYFGEVLGHLLDIAQNDDEANCKTVLQCTTPFCKGMGLIDIAGEMQCDIVLSHTLTKRILAARWNDRSLKGEEERCYGKICQKFLSPRNKLYIHMAMYVISYITVTVYTLRMNFLESSALKWITFIMVTSLAVDEARQAVGDNGKVSSCLRNWWSDSWNKLDCISMLIYYIGFCLNVAKIPESRIVFATFSFIWCLKFYQFLRAFESVGTYIIIVQKMLPQLGNFSLVALIALIGYGIFMTSTLFPHHNFQLWSTVLMVLVRPYLLLFAETGINAYGLSNKSTLFNTPKVPTSSEILTVLGMCVFLMFGGILLMNLLIAVFSGIYEEVKEKSERLWVINDFELLIEFEQKPLFPIPLSLPRNLFRIAKRIGKKTKQEIRDPHLNGKETISDKDKVKVLGPKQEKYYEEYSKDEDDRVHSLQQLKKTILEDVEKRFGALEEQNNKIKSMLEGLLEQIL